MKKFLMALILRYTTLLRFGIVGVVNTGVDFGVFTLLHQLTPASLELAQVCGYTAGTLNSFLMNRLWTFAADKNSSRTSVQLLRFLVVNGASLLVTTLTIRGLVSGAGLNAYAAKLIATVAGQIINYAGYRLFVFSRRAL